MPKHGSINLYVHGSQKARKDGQLRTATSTLTQLLNYGTSASKSILCLTSTETMRLIRDVVKGGRGYGGGGRGRLYSCRYAAVTTRMTSTLRWAAMRAILMFHNCGGKGHKTVSTEHNF